MTPRRAGLVVTIVLSGFVCAGSVMAQAAPAPEGEGVRLRKPIERFSGTVTLRSRNGSSQLVQVVIRDWTIDNRLKIAQFRRKGS
jgi:hypothetical protein